MSKLPKWAQRYIQNLERDLDSRNQEIAALTGEVVKEPGRMTFGYSLFGSGEHPIPEHDHVTVYQRGSKPGWPVGSIEVRAYDDRVEIHGSDSIRIEPRASNVVNVELVRS
jgi:hypothetical protein